MLCTQEFKRKTGKDISGNPRAVRRCAQHPERGTKLAVHCIHSRLALYYGVTQAPKRPHAISAPAAMRGPLRLLGYWSIGLLAEDQH